MSLSTTTLASKTLQLAQSVPAMLTAPLTVTFCWQPAVIPALVKARLMAHSVIDVMRFIIQSMVITDGAQAVGAMK